MRAVDRNQKFKRLLRVSHCPEHRRVIACATGRDQEVEHLADLLDCHPGLLNLPSIDVFDLAIYPGVFC